MVSVAELLNPEPPRAPLPTSRPAAVHPASSQTITSRNEPLAARPSIKMSEMAENSRASARCRVRGVVNFPPFEALDDVSLREVRRFNVYPLGSIQDTSERIPYNSGKKDFFSKTGREGFEVFHYDFKVPGDNTSYTVMWDYNVGLVRMTPFFKCRGYSKTTPAKMLNQNPGLKDITHSITGGSIKAQGYWMPYPCARAVCATFCHKIAGALIPLFGPQFPFECIPEKATGHGRMVINTEIVARARSEAAAQSKPTVSLPSPRPSRSLSPQASQRLGRGPEAYNYHQHNYDHRLMLSPRTDTEIDYYRSPDPYAHRAYPTELAAQIAVPRGASSAPAAHPTPLQSPGWTAVNQRHPPSHHRAISHLNEELLGLNVSAAANPWLSAVPRSPTPGSSRLHPCYPRLHPPHHQASPTSTPYLDRPIKLPPLRLKRCHDQVDAQAAAAKEQQQHDTDRDSHRDDEDHETNPAHDARSRSHSPLPPTDRPAAAPAAAEAHEDDLRAPPPTPTSTTSSTLDNNNNNTNNGTHPGGTQPESEPGTRSPSSSPFASPQLSTTAMECDTQHSSRPAAERDAAIMLMHMRANRHSHSPSPSVSPVSGGRWSPARTAAVGTEGGEVGDTDGRGGERNGGRGSGSDGRGRRPSSMPTPPLAVVEEVPCCEAFTPIPAPVAANRTPESSVSPNTRAKRRRTVDC